jgi:hypothetical protein
MRAEATIVLDQVDDAVTIPVQSVFSQGRLQFVYKPSGTRFERTPIRLGRRSETQAEVLAGLAAGDRVLVRAPEPGEVIGQGWNKANLETVGFTLDESGQPVPAERTGRPARGGQEQPRSTEATPKEGEKAAAAEVASDQEKSSGETVAVAAEGDPVEEPAN